MKYIILIFLTFSFCRVHSQSYSVESVLELGFNSYELSSDSSFTWRLDENNTIYKPTNIEISPNALMNSELIEILEFNSSMAFIALYSTAFDPLNENYFFGLIYCDSNGVINELLPYSSFDPIPLYNWIKLSENDRSLQLILGVTLQGYTTESTFVVSKVSNHLKVVLSLPFTYEDNYGVCEVDDCYSYSSTISLISCGVYDKMNIKVLTTGLRLSENAENVEEFEQVRLFVFDDKKGEYCLKSNEIKNDSVPLGKK